MNWRITSAGELAVYKGGSSIATTSGLNIIAGAWYYIEFKVVTGTTGTYELRVDGVNVLSSGSYNTKTTNNYHTTFRLTGWESSSYGPVFDDLYCLDGSTGLDTDFLGNMRVVTIRPDGAGGSTQWTPDTGSNYARVNEEVCGDDSNYVEDSTTGHEDLYDYAALTGIVGDIKGVMVCTDCRCTDATSFTLKTACNSGGTESDDAGQAISSTTFVTKKRVIEKDPHTTAAWDIAGINAAQFGILVG